jgi:hypothetical protein
MSTAFGVSEALLVGDLAHFICANRIACKIDQVSGVIEVFVVLFIQRNLFFFFFWILTPVSYFVAGYSHGDSQLAVHCSDQVGRRVAESCAEALSCHHLLTELITFDFFFFTSHSNQHKNYISKYTLSGCFTNAVVVVEMVVATCTLHCCEYQHLHRNQREMVWWAAD